MTMRRRTLLLVLAIMLPGAATAQVQKASISTRTVNKAVNPYTVPLNDIGIADVRFINPRQPVEVKKRDEYIPLEFVNRTADRTFIVTMSVRLPLANLSANAAGKSVIADATAKSIARSYGLPNLVGCKPDGSFMKCTAVLTIYPSANASGRFSADFLAAIKSDDGLLRFDVRLFSDNKKLSRPRGYLFIPPKEGADVPEPEDETPVKPVASLGMNRDPRIDQIKVGDDQVDAINGDHLFTGSKRTHFPGAARIDVTHNVGSRANADLSFRFNKADFGDQAETATVKAASYKFSVYSLNLITLDFGKYDFAAPADGISISETGQGFTLTRPFDRGSVLGSYIIKRERTFTASDNDGDSSAAILQVNDVPIGGDFFRSLNITTLYGKDDSHKDPHAYRSGGVEVFFGLKPRETTSLGGSVSAFRSNRSRSVTTDATTGTTTTTPRGRGTAVLLHLNLSAVIDKNTGKDPIVHDTFGLTCALGSGDRKGTDVNEGYIGETDGFSPDALFFSSFAGALRSGAEHAKNPDAALARRIGAGLSNKRYIALDYRNNDFSLLQLFADALRIQKSEVISKSTTLSVRRYDFVHAPFEGGSRSIGMEYAVNFEIETPQSVTVTMGASYFTPASSVSSLIKKNAFQVGAAVKIEP
jgi:hypothetical protein